MYIPESPKKFNSLADIIVLALQHIQNIIEWYKYTSIALLLAVYNLHVISYISF